ncbi:unnamed protein product [Coffea canephora]|uniref:Uncharacterized protein n=1 Tax=Coffea canephora TaxID=49390 RepID=A0A068UPC5_COFCA|nr:unnamed protein product [Coffea canephora]
MEMASTCSSDRVFLDLELLLNRFRDRDVLYDARGSIKHMKFLKTFLMCARKWSQSNDLYLESDNVVKKMMNCWNS